MNESVTRYAFAGELATQIRERLRFINWRAELSRKVQPIDCRNRRYHLLVVRIPQIKFVPIQPH
ncbi:MAG: hypothetical protein A3G24_01370 [Betaproteobacteria bacterium RIFCSPLOWO2_12_FULL_62_13]|nr:MAG: hypothetical protein A3G24_01370 [Betaproteobacteria bacterium RIFCSPLOWO2_12_FULL_62_13]